jgi:hypothetical protein
MCLYHMCRPTVATMIMAPTIHMPTSVNMLWTFPLDWEPVTDWLSATFFRATVTVFSHSVHVQTGTFTATLAPSCCDWSPRWSVKLVCPSLLEKLPLARLLVGVLAKLLAGLFVWLLARLLTRTNFLPPTESWRSECPTSDQLLSRSSSYLLFNRCKEGIKMREI